MKMFSFKYFMALILILGTVELAHATQMHSASEGVIVHQIGHVFFLISMVILYFTIQGKQLHQERGWRSIQLSSLFFVLWNLDALMVHFFDNQIHLVSSRILSMWEINIDVFHTTREFGLFYYFLRLDHLLCLPGMILLWRGLVLMMQKDDDSKDDIDEIEDALVNASEDDIFQKKDVLDRDEIIGEKSR